MPPSQNPTHHSAFDEPTITNTEAVGGTRRSAVGTVTPPRARATPVSRGC
ncbi:hypothetical protein [Actinomycetospora sp. CA-053990]